MDEEKIMVTFWDLAAFFVGVMGFFAVVYFLGRGEGRKKREALFPFVSGEEYHPMRIPYRVKWIYYVALFTMFETAGLLVMLALSARIPLIIPAIYIAILSLSLLIAPKE